MSSHPTNHSLADLLQGRARQAGGWLRFDQFMDGALYHPTEGYYSRPRGPSGPFGAEGDFVTAPLLGPWLALCLAQRHQQLRRQQPERARTIVELGAGTGQLAADLLQALAEADQLPQHYQILELSPGLAELQQERIAAQLSASADRAERQGEGALAARLRQAQASLRWISSLPPQSVEGLILANEVADALPVRLFEWRGEGHQTEWVLEWGLVWQADAQRWTWSARPADEPLEAVVRARAAAAADRGYPWQSGHRGEWCPWLTPWGGMLAQALAWGELVLIDYGFEQYELDHPERASGTLAGHHRQQRIDDHDALVALAGEIDLTAQVNFTELALALEAGGCASLSLKTQTAWMMDQGLLDLAQQRLFDDRHPVGQVPNEPSRLQALAQLQTLLSDGAMGQRFLVLSASRS